MCQSSLSTNFLLTFEELLDVKRPRTDGTLKRLAPSSVSSSFYLLLLLVVIIMHYCLLLCLVFVFNVFSVAVLSSFCSLSSSSPSLSFFISFFFLLYLHCPLFVSSVFVVFSVLIFIFFSVLCCRLLNLLCLCFLFTVTSCVFFLLLCCLIVVFFFSSLLFSSSSSVLFVSSLPLSSNHLGLLYHPVSSLTGRQV